MPMQQIIVFGFISFALVIISVWKLILFVIFKFCKPCMNLSFLIGYGGLLVWAIPEISDTSLNFTHTFYCENIHPHPLKKKKKRKKKHHILVTNYDIKVKLIPKLVHNIEWILKTNKQMWLFLTKVMKILNFVYTHWGKKKQSLGSSQIYFQKTALLLY